MTKVSTTIARRSLLVCGLVFILGCAAAPPRPVDGQKWFADISEGHRYAIRAAEVAGKVFDIIHDRPAEELEKPAMIGGLRPVIAEAREYYRKAQGFDTSAMPAAPFRPTRTSPIEVTFRLRSGSPAAIRYLVAGQRETRRIERCEVRAQSGKTIVRWTGGGAVWLEPFASILSGDREDVSELIRSIRAGIQKEQDAIASVTRDPRPGPIGAAVFAALRAGDFGMLSQLLGDGPSASFLLGNAMMLNLDLSKLGAPDIYANGEMAMLASAPVPAGDGRPKVIVITLVRKDHPWRVQTGEIADARDLDNGGPIKAFLARHPDAQKVAP